MSKSNKGMICILGTREWEDWDHRGVSPDCRNHRHISRRRACERFDDARFADEILAHVYNSQHKRIAFIARLGQRVIWTRHWGDLRSELGIVSAQSEMINTHVKRIQAAIDSGKQPFVEAIILPRCRTEPRYPPRGAAISQTLREHSPHTVTAHESELNAEGALARRRAERDHQELNS
jgi:hypothetical protein